jgi:DNA-binding transcriptional ArsR family regulator
MTGNAHHRAAPSAFYRYDGEASLQFQTARDESLPQDLATHPRKFSLRHRKSMLVFKQILNWMAMASETEKAAAVFRVLGAENRLRIMELLRTHSFCVNALAVRLKLTPAAVSQHLRVLREVGLVESDKRGYYVHYRLNERRLDEWRDLADRVLAAKGKE